jgi:uncharacterized protein YjiS (DUF1127 family)
MTTTEFTPARPAKTAAWMLHLAETGIAWIAALHTAISNRRMVGRLLEMDDRMLGDIGLTRGDVQSSLSGSVVDDPTSRLNSFWMERRSAVRASARQRIRPPSRGREI